MSRRSDMMCSATASGTAAVGISASATRNHWAGAAGADDPHAQLAAVATGIAPIPEPIPAALVAHTLGPLPKPGVLALGLVAHFAYGGGAEAVLAAATKRVTFWGGLGYAVLLWLVMGLVWLPYLGWGLFGTAQAPPIAAATLVLHLVYGVTLGALFTWRQPR